MAALQNSRWGRVRVSNIGGIETADIELTTGVNVLTGENATNRTSFLKALSGALGSTNISIKGDATEAWVELVADEESYRCEITQEGGSRSFAGETYLDDADTAFADRFAFLFERNPARNAIRQGEDLYDIIMEPVDTAAIESQIATLKEKRSQLEAEKDAIDEKLGELPDLRQERQTLDEQIGDLEAEIDEKQRQLEDAEASIEESQARAGTLEESVETLQSKRSTLSDLEGRIETTCETIDELEGQLEDKRDERASLSVEEETLTAVEERLSERYEAISRKEEMMNELQNIMQFNREMVEGDAMQSEVFAALRAGNEPVESDQELTDTLVDGDEQDLVCWTCGNTTNEADILETITRLKSVHEDLFGERRQLRETVQDLEEKKETIQAQKRRRDALGDEIEQLTTQLERHRQRVEKLRAQRDDLTTEIDSLEAEIEQLQAERDDRVLALHQSLSELEYRLQQRTDEREEVAATISDRESLDGDRERIAEEVSTVEAELTELRGKIDRIEHRTVEAFNHHMDEMLAVLEYDNIDRIWIERKEVETNAGRRTVSETRFDLHVVRTTADGTAYEDTVEHLSESEREVTGLIFALAGYLVHEVHEVVPCMLLDSLEAIDSHRIASLIAYFEEFVPNVVVALLPEDAAALPEAYNRIETI